MVDGQRVRAMGMVGKQRERETHSHAYALRVCLSLSRTDRAIPITGIRQIINLRRYESLTLHDVLQGFSIADCEWLVPTGAKARAQRAAQSDDLKRREILQEWMWWFFVNFVMSILKVRRSVGRVALGPADTLKLRRRSTSPSRQLCGTECCTFGKTTGFGCVNQCSRSCVRCTSRWSRR